MSNTEDLTAFVGECLARMEAIVAEGDGELTDAQRAEFNQCDEWVTTARGKIDEQAMLTEALVRGRETLDRVAEIPAVPEAKRFENVNVNIRTNPFDLDGVDRHAKGFDAELRARAETVVESHLPSVVTDEAREGIAQTIAKQSSRNYDAVEVNEHIIRTSTPEYADAFAQFMQTMGSVASPILFDHVPTSQRTAMSLTAANGGVLVPQYLDPTIVLTNAGQMNDIRKIASQRSITVDQWDGVTSAGVTAEWLAEGSEAADATPTFVAPTITVHKLAAYAMGSVEVIADSGFAEVGTLIADAFDRAEGTAFTTGTGSGQPYGVVTELSGTGPVVTGSSGAAGAADFVAADIYALDDNLGARWRGNASFLSSRPFLNDIRQLGTSNTYHAFWTSFGGGIPPELIGYPVYQAEDMDSTIVSGSNDYPIILGDFQQYRIIDRIGTAITFNPLVIGSNQRPTGQVGWFAYKRVGARVLTSNAFKTLKL